MTTASAPVKESPHASYDAMPTEYHTEPRWHLSALLAFRLCFIYFGLYVVTTQMLPAMLPIPGLDLPDLGVLPPARTVFLWIGAHVMGIAHPIAFRSTGSGDKLFDWVQSFSLLLIAFAGCALWTLRDRTNTRDVRIYRWFRVFLRFALGTSMIGYGFAKAIPLQMPTTMLNRLIEPYGNFSPMGVLWASIGASPSYEVFVGLAEVLGGVLLFFPRTATLGALICLADATEVFALNMTYDVPVKMFSFHLILISLFLLAPNLRRLFDLIILQRDGRIVGEPAIGRTPNARRNLVILQAVVGVYAILANLFGSVQAYKVYGGGAPRPAFFGIWDVAQMTVDGAVRPPLLTDSTRWKRVLFQNTTGVAFQRMADNFKFYGASLDTNAKKLVLTTFDSSKARYTLGYQRPTPDQLLLDGTMAGQVVHLELKRRDLHSFQLESRGFHWVSEVPFNR